MRKLLLLALLLFAVPCYATFPTVAATNSGNSAANGTSITVNLPSGVGTGDLMITCVTWDGAPTSINWPSSGGAWTSLYSQACSGSTCLNACRYRIATGAETSYGISWTGSEGSSWVVYRIEGHNSSTTAPQVGTAAAPTASVNPDPPVSASPSGGTQDYLFIVTYGWDGNNSHTSYPANYTDNQVTNRWANSNGTGTAIASRNLNTGSTSDPGTATISGSDEWVAQTIIVHPGTEGNLTATQSIPLMGVGNGK